MAPATRRRVEAVAHFAAALALAAIVASAAGCSSSSSPQKLRTPTPGVSSPTGSVSTPGASATAPLPAPLTPLSLPQIAGDPFDVALTRVEGGASNFTIETPPEWVHEAAGGVDRFVIKAGAYQVGFVTIECHEPKNPYPDEPYTSINLAQREAGGVADHTQLGSTGGVTAIDVNGLRGATYSDERTVGFAGTQGVSVFFAEPDCAWVIRFVYGANTDQPKAYQTLFGRVVSTFIPGTKQP